MRGNVITLPSGPMSERIRVYETSAAPWAVQKKGKDHSEPGVEKMAKVKKKAGKKGEEPVWLYVVECSDGTFYTGISANVWRRLWQHNNSKRGAKYTSTRRPVKLRKCWKYPNRGAALRAEKAFKKFSREKKIEKMGSSRHPC